MRMKEKGKIQIIIIVLSVLLVTGLLILGGIKLYKKNRPDAQQTSATVPDNIITQEEKETKETTDQTTGAEETEAAETETAETEIAEPSSQAPDESKAAEESTAAAATETGTPATTGGAAATETGTAVTLHKRKAQDNVKFQVGNMFPGDSETASFCVRVSHKDNVTLRFHADIRPGYEKLAEVMRCRVMLPDKNELIYDGVMRDMPAALNHALNTNKSTTSEVYYEITAYLETSVGNEYMNQSLVVDFRWWVDETANLDPPVAGDSSNLFLWLGTASGALLLLILILRKNKKEDAADEQ